MAGLWRWALSHRKWLAAVCDIFRSGGFLFAAHYFC